MAAQLTFFRPSGWMDRWRAYDITVNDAVVTRLKRNRTFQFSCVAGKYDLCAMIDWCQSAPLTLTIADGETVQIEVSNPNTPFRAMRMIRHAPDTYLEMCITGRGPIG